MSRESYGCFCNSQEVSNYVNYQNDFVNPFEVPICMSMCLNTTAPLGPPFVHFFKPRIQVLLRFPEQLLGRTATSQLEGGPCATPCPFLAQAGINTASPPCPCALRALNQQPGCTWSRELLPQHVPTRQLATAQPGGCLQSTWMHMQLFPAQQS